MEIERTTDSVVFAHAVTPFLTRDPIGNTILLTVLDHERATPTDDAWFSWASHGGEVVGAALRTPPYNVALAAMDPGVAAVLGSHDHSPGAVGSRDVVEAFAGERAVGTYMRETQYVLTDLVTPPQTPGAARHYRPSDADLYVRWIEAFVVETGVTRGSEPLCALHNRLSSGGALWIWERGGEPVAMAGRSAPVCGVPRIGPVWTPVEHRRNGYATALTAHVCADAFALGATACTLFADAGNATSNGVYVRLGFRAIREIINAGFTETTTVADVS